MCLRILVLSRQAFSRIALVLLIPSANGLRLHGKADHRIIEIPITSTTKILKAEHISAQGQYMLDPIRVGGGEGEIGAIAAHLGIGGQQPSLLRSLIAQVHLPGSRPQLLRCPHQLAGGKGDITPWRFHAQSLPSASLWVGALQDAHWVPRLS